MPSPTETIVSELLRERLRLDDELARHQQAVTVLFVDIVGSTRFYEQYGDVAGLTMVQKFLDKLVPIINEHGGTVVKTIGDAILARFQTGLEGVRSGLNMQWSLEVHNSTRPPVEQIHIRVAVNSGFALIKGTDVFGDVVNVCSRIESAAQPGDILISPSVYDQICQVEDIAVRKRATGVQLKGKTEKLDLYEVVWRSGEPAGPAPPRPSQSQVAMATLMQVPAAPAPPAEEARKTVLLPPAAAPPRPAAVAPPRAMGRTARIAVAGSVLVLLGLFTAIFLSNRGPQGLGPNVKMTRITNSGKATQVALSPDGRYVVYVSQDGERQSLNVRNVATGSDIRVLAPEVTVFSGLSFSPDGNYIYLVHSARNNPNYSDLFSIPVLGGPELHVVRDIDSAVTFSPDGKQMAFVRGVPTTHEVQVIVAAADGGSERSLLRQRASTFFETMFPPAWSPDGKTIAVTIRDSANPWYSSIVTVDVASGKATTIYSTGDPAGAPQWRSGGRALLLPVQEAFLGYRGQLWQVSVPGGKAARVTNDLTDYGLCCLNATHDGKAWAAVEQVLASELWLWSAGSKPAPITSGGPSALSMSWTRNNDIVFHDASGALGTVRRDGKNRALLTRMANGSIWPSACGDGHVVFAAPRGTGLNLWRVDADGANLTQVGTQPFAGRPQCSPDGAWIVYVGNDGIGWRIPSGGGTPKRLMASVSDRRTAISPDGKLVAYISMPATPSGPNLLRIVQADSGVEAYKFDLPVGASEPEWAAGANGVDFLLTRDGVSNIWRQPLAGGRPVQVTNFDSGIIFHYAWSRDAKQLAFARGSARNDIIFIENVP